MCKYSIIYDDNLFSVSEGLPVLWIKQGFALHTNIMIVQLHYHSIKPLFYDSQCVNVNYYSSSP